MVLGLVHLEDGVAHHLAHDLGVARRRERLAVLEHLLHRVEPEGGEDVDVRQPTLDSRLVAHHSTSVELFALDLVLGAHEREDRVRVLDDTDAGAAVEVLEGVVRVVVLVGVRRRHVASPSVACAEART